MLKIHRAEERATKRAAVEMFTGDVFQDEVLVGEAPSRMRATNVTFNPGARTAWHQHPVGQTLWAVAGVGRGQVEGGPVEGASARRHCDHPAQRAPLAWRRTGPDFHPSRHVGDGRGRRWH